MRTKTVRKREREKKIQKQKRHKNSTKCSTWHMQVFWSSLCKKQTNLTCPWHVNERSIYMNRGGLGQNFRPGNLTLIQAIPYTHNKFWNMDNPISLFIWPSHKKSLVWGRGKLLKVLFWTAPSLRGVMPIQSEGHVPPQIFEPSGFWMQLPKDKK